MSIENPERLATLRFGQCSRQRPEEKRDQRERGNRDAGNDDDAAHDGSVMILLQSAQGFSLRSMETIEECSKVRKQFRAGFYPRDQCL